VEEGRIHQQNQQRSSFGMVGAMFSSLLSPGKPPRAATPARTPRAGASGAAAAAGAGWAILLVTAQWLGLHADMLSGRLCKLDLGLLSEAERNKAACWG
jgi:hypothetical protein